MSKTKKLRKTDGHSAHHRTAVDGGILHATPCKVEAFPGLTNGNSGVMIDEESASEQGN
jgi:hypothetical protein